MALESNKQVAGMPKVASHENLRRMSSHRSVDEKLVLEWSDINFSVNVPDSTRSSIFHTVYKEKKILQNCSGRISSGSLVSILGPTGSGKTSLLNILASRVPCGASNGSKLTGSFRVNGQMRDEQKFRRVSAYVLQDDLLFAHLTVFETLMLAANFYLPDELPDSEKKEVVMGVLTELGLLKAKDTIIGDDKVRGVSGGERKRANIAAQLICDPAVLFLDEPTSGLDSFQAQSVMEAMKISVEARLHEVRPAHLSQKGLAMIMHVMGSHELVVAVIHQPRSTIYSMFDQMMLLSEGRVMYFGQANAAVDHFGKQGFSCPSLFNPSDYFLDILSPDARGVDLDEASRARIAQLGNHWAAVGAIRKRTSSAADEEELAAQKSNVKAIGNASSLSRTLRNFSLLAWRASAEQMRNVASFKIKLVGSIIFGLIIAGIYQDLGKDQASIQNRTGLLFFVAINQSFNGLIGVLNTFPKEKSVVNRELSNRAYDTFSYFVAKLVTELPLNCVPPMMFSTIIYWIVGLNPAPDRILQFYGIISMLALSACALGLVVSAVAPNVDAANSLGPPVMIIFLLFGGFYINVQSLPVGANYMPYISFMYWGFKALAINEYAGETFDCDGSAGCLSTGDQVLERLDFDDSSVGDSVFGLFLCTLGFLILAFFVLLRSKVTYVPLTNVDNKAAKTAKAAKAAAAAADSDPPPVPENLA